MMRWLLVEGAQTAARKDEDLRRAYQRLKFRRVSGVAKVAMARRLAVRLYWMLRAQVNYAQLVRISGSPSSRWSRKRRDRTPDWAPGLPRRGREFELRIMVPRERGRSSFRLPCKFRNPNLSCRGFAEAHGPILQAQAEGAIVIAS